MPGPADDAAVCDFLLLLSSDLESGGPRPLSDYLSRFPDHELAIAREYLASLPQTNGAVNGAASPAPSAAEAPSRDARYAVVSELARGGMGTVLRVQDVVLGREIAMKVESRGSPSSERRFLAEAGITGRLDHPGVVPVHDVGRTEHGRSFFTMRLIQGRTFKDVIDELHRGDGNASFARALDVMAKVCDTMAYAHSRGIVHRDLKPANVMTGEFGEVYVVDWGLARSAKDADPHDVRLRGAESDSASADSPLVTMDGDVLGTPSYMAPEQAMGTQDELGPAADVYSAGAMLYHLLAGRPPYSVPGETRHHREVLDRVRREPLAPLETVKSDLPPELVSICERAMQRDRRARYPDMRAMAADLRAFLEGRVVAAHAAGAWTRARKWVLRNRALSGAVLSLVVVGAVAAVLVLMQSAARQKTLRMLTDAITPQTIENRFEAMWPIDARRIRETESLLAEARAVVLHQDEYARELEALRARALPMDPDAPLETRFRRTATQLPVLHAQLADRIEKLIGEIDAGQAELPFDRTRDSLVLTVKDLREKSQAEKTFEVPHLTYRFEDPVDQILYEALVRLAPALEALTGTESRIGFVPLAERSVALARAAADAVPLDVDARWSAAIDEIADASRSPVYSGLRITRQEGLLPIGKDPASGLFEFAHLLSGKVPSRDASSGRLAIDTESCIVLVLVPSTQVELGSQKDDPKAKQFDPWATPGAPVSARHDLHPYFLGKYEITEAQWTRLTTRAATRFWSADPADPAASTMRAAGWISFEEATKALARVGLVLPTEAQWECATRAGTTTVWPTGDARESIRGFANVADSRSSGIAYPGESAFWPDLDDGFAESAPVDALQANRFGLHGMLGNVAEWCRDKGPVGYERSNPDYRTGERAGKDSDEGLRAARGGSFRLSALWTRSAARRHLGPTFRDSDVGARAARDLDP